MKKPDLVVWDEDKGYYSKELTYGSSVGAPAIKLEDVAGWKSSQASQANKIFKTKYEELKEEFSKLVEEVNWNEIVYSSQYSFIPVIGETYHLYSSNNNQLFLSLIGPNEWNQQHVGSFRLDSTNKWIKVL